MAYWAAESRPLVGRAAEQAAVRDVLSAAVSGTAGALLVSGEAGVGKTALVRSAAGAAGPFAVFWATCLPLTSLTVPFLPLTAALREWTATGHGPAPSDLDPTAFDAWLDAACGVRPVLLVVDDLHWADRSTLDVLTCVLALPPRRRLAVVLTQRSGEVGPGHALHRWLADARRQPGFAELHLDRLDRAATAEQLTGLLGRPPLQALVDAVYARTAGNAYLTVLLARGLDPDADAPATGLPSDLREALTRTWHGLSPDARRLTSLIAVAGGPVDTATLQSVDAGSAQMASLRESVDAGVLIAIQDRYWFAHPLLAEVLEEGLLPDERRALHATFAAELKRGGEDTIAVADHYHRAGNPVEAFAWALRGAEAAEHAGGAAEGLRLLRRALDLLPSVPDADLSRMDLLSRLRTAAERVGDQEVELAAIDELLTLVDRLRAPLVAAELLVRQVKLRHSTGRTFADLEQSRQAEVLTAPYRDSVEHALATAQLAFAELWLGLDSGPASAREAARLARACGSPVALVYGLTVEAMAYAFAGDFSRCDQATQAARIAVRIRDFWGHRFATTWANQDLEWSDDAHLAAVATGFVELTAARAPHPFLANLAAEAAGIELIHGDWRSCADRLRFVFGANPGAFADVDARLTAALLACWQGRLVESQAHLARAEELRAERSGFRSHPFAAVRAEIAVALGDSASALAATLDGLAQPTTPNLGERLLPTAARALADEARRRRDRGADPAGTVARLADLRRRYPSIRDADTFESGESLHRAMQGLYDAEAARGAGTVEAADRWLKAAGAAREAGLPWDEAYASWRAAEASLPDRSRRREGVAALRRAYELAAHLEMTSVLSEVEALARAAHVSLTASVAVVAHEPFAALTPRQREIVPHLVAGRTYAEIAAALFITDKTVSSHVSAILDRTGCANRIELAQLYRRLNGNPGTPG